MKFELERRIDPDHAALPGHFPGNPVVPGVVILSEVENAMRSAFGEGTQLAALPKIRFLALLRPGQAFRVTLERLESSPGERAKVRFSVSREGQPIATGLAQCRDANAGN